MVNRLGRKSRRFSSEAISKGGNLRDECLKLTANSSSFPANYFGGGGTRQEAAVDSFPDASTE